MKLTRARQLREIVLALARQRVADNGSTDL